jgi:hypothetical protein
LAPIQRTICFISVAGEVLAPEFISIAMVLVSKTLNEV